LNERAVYPTKGISSRWLEEHTHDGFERIPQDSGWYKTDRPGSDSTDYAASWIADFTVALSLPDVTVASCPVPKIQMINFPIHVEIPTTNKPIITTTAKPSQLSGVEDIATPQETPIMPDIVHPVGNARVSVPDSLCVDRQGGDEENG
jgi:hypothetical protein